jgi:A/G-specific adenine glycosylase
LPWRQPGRAADIYAVWVSEVMLQQTQVATVVPYYRRFLERFPSVRHLAEGTEQEVLKLWEGLGYYSRGRNLHRAAQCVMDEYNGKIPEAPEEFRKLPGVGSYIAAAVLSITRNIPLPAVDGNVMRVYTRFRGMGDDIRKTGTKNRIFNELKDIIPPGAAGDFTQAFMELGAVICTPRNPRCPACPFREAEACTAFTTHTVDRYPFKSPTRKVPEYPVSVGIIVKEGNTFYIQKRPSTGHLGGLWEFPGGKARKGETPEQALHRECREELGCEVEIIRSLPVVRHAYSHFKIEMSPFICRLKGEDVHPQEGLPFRWVTVDQLADYPFPAANHQIFPHLKAFFV